MNIVFSQFSAQLRATKNALEAVRGQLQTCSSQLKDCCTQLRQTKPDQSSSREQPVSRIDDWCDHLKEGWLKTIPFDIQVVH